MTWQQGLVFAVLAMTLGLFIWNRLRFDIVALIALLALALVGIVPAEDAFSGFGHPAVITVAAVLVVSRGLTNSGVVDLLARALAHVGDRPAVQVAVLTAVVAVCSAFMNNVGALALLLPVAIRMARKTGRSPSMLLMPIAFGSLLGGMTTLIGTPPNIIVSTLRAEVVGAPFSMFNYTPAGVLVALSGVLFISIVGWRLVPQREAQASRDTLFRISDYTAEVRIPEDSKLAGTMVMDLENQTEEDITIAGILRGKRRMAAPSGMEILRGGDILVVEADSVSLQKWIAAAHLEIVTGDEQGEALLRAEDVQIAEAVVTPDSMVHAAALRPRNLRRWHGVNLLAVARYGQRLTQRMASIRVQPGDVILLQGHENAVNETITELALLPLAERGLRIGRPRRIVFSTLVFLLALMAAAMGLVQVQVAFVAAAVAMLAFGLLSMREAYEAIDWPILVLLGAMIPVGSALESTGGALLLGNLVLGLGDFMPPLAVLAVLLVVTMCLSDIVNNAAAAVLMAPIGINIARGLGASMDPFLMVIAVGSSCAFLTPIGHQSNTLVMGPGGYRFGDYWRMGLPLSVVVMVTTVLTVSWVWPLFPGSPPGNP